MRVSEYFKDRLLFLTVQLILFVILAVVLMMFGMGTGFLAVVFGIWFVPLLSYVVLELAKHKRFYDELSGVLEQLERKYLLPEVVEAPSFLEGRLLHQMLKETAKAMHEHVNQYRDLQKEYRDYIEAWVHEVKTPIASARLIIGNNENPATKGIDYELKKIEDNVEQVLYYARSQNVSQDFIVKRLSLKAVVIEAVRRSSRDFINKRIAVDLDGVEGAVYSDAKWLGFILHQIIGNAVKYSEAGTGKVKISTVQEGKVLRLVIEDNGIGIVDRDLNRVWEKGFTGENGRLYNKSTGIGLYLCKSLCEKLGLGISLDSQAGEGTRVAILFPAEEII